MKYENLILHCLFFACIFVCGLIFAAILTTAPPSTQLATGSKISAILLAAPSTCALPPDDVVCPRTGS